ncbi:MAG TPA: hypothetical protein PLJ21_06450, partial [Pseudobdellovibrionaceae bacterium]|nr:hypothetical protein [Pseudobdellovibrionaceae bacterium]
IKSCIFARRQNKALTVGEFKVIHQSEGLIAYLRYTEEIDMRNCEEAIVVFNVSTSEKNITLSFSKNVSISVAINPINKEKLVLGENQTLNLKIPARSGQLWLSKV